MFSHFIWLFCFNIFSIFDIKAKIVYNTLKNDLTRATVHQPSVIDKTCLLKPDIGPCRSEIPMYFYKPSDGNCSLFIWGGCQGNGNRFDTNRECMTTCLSQSGQTKRRPKWCSLSFDYGFCFGALERWYYDPLWKVCKKRIYSGCGGNKNNFYNKEQCDSICKFATGVIRPPEKGQSGVKKVLIVNPWSATKKKGRNQTTTKIVAKPLIPQFQRL
ncbi:BPTI/Kunitz domain-containing protein-like [Vanessa cardui]|uniref:BPTI/Kunitz domain-containing protein-like n=1 Tax=Vanessa cardui TaxID=171605 RepID=UPI001F1400E3|nr:BPTI/Kunitz domain-containing protein-like [Vanessa cardui]